MHESHTQCIRLESSKSTQQQLMLCYLIHLRTVLTWISLFQWVLCSSSRMTHFMGTKVSQYATKEKNSWAHLFHYETGDHYRVESVLSGTVLNSHPVIKQSVVTVFLPLITITVIFTSINPFTPTSDQDRISPYNINTISSRQVMRIEKNINYGNISWSNTKFSELTS